MASENNDVMDEDFDQISLDGEPVGADDAAGLDDEGDNEFGVDGMGDDGGFGGGAGVDSEGEESEMVVLDPDHPLMTR